jgi:hypothetical protein
MNQSWQEEFDQAMKSFGIVTPEPIEYRIHYDNTGHITMCSMQQHPANTQYLVVDKDLYDHYYQYKVNIHRKRLEKIAIDLGIRVKLKKSDHGYAVVKNHAGLLLESDETYENIEYYDTVD